VTDEPRIEHRAVDPGCGREVETPRQEPWLVDGATQHAPTLVAFECPHCEHEIRLDD
jgi:hypothetical protein